MNFLGLLFFYIDLNVFLLVNVNTSLPSASIRMGGVVLVNFSCCWHTTYKILQSIGSKGRCLKKCSKPCWPIRTKVTWQITPLILLSQFNFTFTGRNVFIIGKSPKKVKTGRDPYLGLDLSIHVNKSHHSSGDTVPLKSYCCSVATGPTGWASCESSLIQSQPVSIFYPIL